MCRIPLQNYSWASASCCMTKFSFVSSCIVENNKILNPYDLGLDLRGFNNFTDLTHRGPAVISLDLDGYHTYVIELLQTKFLIGLLPIVPERLSGSTYTIATVFGTLFHDHSIITAGHLSLVSQARTKRDATLF